ncbi:MAG: HNH endonuclease [Rikenellaceae bacterium]
MKNLKAYNSDATKAYKDAVQRKGTSDAKDCLLQIETKVCDAYQKYKDCFDANSLCNIQESDFAVSADEKRHLLDMYSYRSKIIKDIKANITNQQLVTIQTTCQNCTIDSVGTMDHIIPKEKYPIYAVNGYNLFPCCSKCNSYKLDSVSADSFLNLFLDTLPEVQYLFVDVYNDYGLINFRFYLSNDNGSVDVSLFNRITNHYDNLHLLERMKDAATTYLSDFIVTTKSYYKQLGKEIVAQITTENIKEKRKGYGYNYWKCSLELALINSDVFWDHLDSLM